MGVGDVVGRILYRTEVDDSGVGGGLRNVEAQVAAANRRISAMRSQVEIQADITDVERKAAQVERMKEQLQERVQIGADADTATAEAQLKALDKMADSLDGRKINLEIERRMSQDIDRVNTKGRALASTMRFLGLGISDTEGKLKQWASSLSSVRVQAGFFSATIRQMAIGLGVLSPIITSLVGTLSALVGVGLEAVAGAALFGAAGLGAFALAAVGLFGAIKPAMSELKLATTAQAAYNKAVITYGKNSDQAKTAQKNLTETLKNVSPEAAAAAKQLTDLTDRWQKLTEPTRAKFFDTLTTGLKSVDRLMPMFSRNVNDTANTLGTNLQHLFRDLSSSPEFKGAINNLMGNFRKSLPDLIGGFDNLAKAVANVFKSVSRFFGPATQGFESWSRGVLHASRDTQKLNHWVDGLMKSLSSVGRFLAAGGKTAWDFFTSGADQGRGLLDEMTTGLEDIDKWINSIEGQNSLHDFFASAISTAKELWGIIKNGAVLIGNLAEAFRPVTMALLKVTQFASDLINTLMDIPIVGGAIQDLATAFAALFVIGKVVGFLRVFGATLMSLVPKAAAATVAVEGLAFDGAAASAATATTRMGGLLTTLGRFSLVAAGVVLGADLIGNALNDALGGDSMNFDEIKSVLDQLQAVRDAAATGTAAIDRVISHAKAWSSAKFAIGLTTSGDAAKQLTSLARQLQALGARAFVAKILASDESAQAKIADLKTKLLDLEHPRRVEIRADLGATLDQLNQIDAAGKKASTPRKVPVATDGEPQVISGLGHIAGFSLPDKSFTIRAFDAASSVLRGVAAVIASLHDVTVHATTIATTVQHAMGGIATPGFAGGTEDVRRGMMVRRPMFAVGEEAPQWPEVVIATNPAYRQDNLAYLKLAAGMLGIPAFRRGGTHHHHHHGGHGGGVDDSYQIGAVPAAAAQAELDKARNAWQQAKQLLQGLNDRKRTAQQSLHQASNSKERGHASQQINDLNGKITSAEKKVSKTHQALQEAEKNSKALKHINSAIALHEAKLTTFEANMDTASATDNTGAWEDARSGALNEIQALLAELRPAYRGAKGVFQQELATRIAELQTEQADLGANPGPAGETLTPNQQLQLDALEAQRSLASLTPDTADDIGTQQALVGFWTNILAGLQARNAPASAIGEAADALLSARQAYSAIGGVQTQQDIYSQARLDLYKAFGSNVEFFKAGFPTAVSPFSAAGGASPGSSDIHITQHFSEPPPDPHTWSAQMAHEMGALGV